MIEISSAPRTLAEAPPGGHLAQLYTDSGQLVRAVGVFAARGLERGEAVVLIMTPDHAAETLGRLALSGLDVAGLGARGRLVFADAAETLRVLLRHGEPDRTLFRQVVGGLVSQAVHDSENGCVRAFGEMVELLRQADSDPAALRLEELWNELLKTEPLTLLCGYRGTARGLPRPLATAHTEVLNPPSSRERMMAAGRELFSAVGFDDAKTAAIVRTAGTSESQLVKHFGHKRGLLKAIFEDWWDRIHVDIDRVASASTTSPAEKLLHIADLLLEALSRDPELARLLLFESRRLHGKERGLVVTGGFRRFVEAHDRILSGIASNHQLPNGLSVQAVRAALIGAFEGLLRDRMTGSPEQVSAAYGFDEIRATYHAFAASLLRVD